MKFAALFLLLSLPLSAQDKGATAFASWWKQFQSAVARKDAASITKGARFPMQWENGKTRDVKTAADLAARFDFYFTPEIKNVVAKRTPAEAGRESRTITWKARGNEYSLYFKTQGGTWVFDGLSAGPP
ncbi:MAG: hypothetical protein ABI811_17885 [Acidobacteriota bacterium]